MTSGLNYPITDISMREDALMRQVRSAMTALLVNGEFRLSPMVNTLDVNIRLHGLGACGFSLAWRSLYLEEDNMQGYIRHRLEGAMLATLKEQYIRKDG